jgi:hypothetical protein
MNATEMLEAMNANSKKQIVKIGDYLDYLLEYDNPLGITDRLLYKTWRDVVYVHGNPTRYLLKPTENDLENIRHIFATYCQGNQHKLFPLFLEHIYSRFDEVCSYAYSNGHCIPFEPHMLGMFLYNITLILNWHGMEYNDE